jgi:hypothetical protein
MEQQVRVVSERPVDVERLVCASSSKGRQVQQAVTDLIATKCGYALTHAVVDSPGRPLFKVNRSVPGDVRAPMLETRG